MLSNMEVIVQSKVELDLNRTYHVPCNGKIIFPRRLDGFEHGKEILVQVSKQRGRVDAIVVADTFDFIYLYGSQVVSAVASDTWYHYIVILFLY